MDAIKVSAAKPKKAGAIYYGPLTATLPTDTTGTLTGFTELGYASEDGVVNTNGPSSDKVKAWGGDTVLSFQSDKPDEFKMTLIEALNEDVLKVIYGSKNVTGTLSSGMTVKANSDDPEVYAWVIDMVLKGGVAKRIVIPRASVSAMEDITYKDDEAIGYGITLTAVPDAAGNTHYEYIKG